MSEWQESGKYPVIGQGAQDIEGWTDRSDLLLTPTSSVVLYGGHTRRAKHVDGSFVAGPNVKILEPAKELDSRFLFHYLTHLPIESKGYADHFPLVRNSIVPIPPKHEQRRIIAILDEAFEGIATANVNAEKNLQNIRDLFNASVRSVISDFCKETETKALERICTIGDGNHSSNYPKKNELVEEGVPFIRATNLVGGHVSDDDMRFLSPMKHAQLKKGHLKAGDILVTNRGEIGRTAIVDEKYHGANLNSQIVWLRCSEFVHNKFVYHVLNSEEIQSHFQMKKNGAALQQFTIKQIRALQIPCPSFSVQVLAAEKIDSFSRLYQSIHDVYSRKILALEELRKSLLHQAFTGQL